VVKHEHVATGRRGASGSSDTFERSECRQADVGAIPSSTKSMAVRKGAQIRSGQKLRQRRRGAACVRAQAGGARGGSGGSRLIVPGDDAFKEASPGPPQGGDAIEGDGSMLQEAGFAPFRPPSDSESPEEYPRDAEPAQAVLETRTGARRWHEAPAHLRELKRRGYTPSQIEGFTGMHPREQADTEIQASVFHSLRGQLGSDQSERFIEFHARSLLPHLRTLDINRRIATAQRLADTSGSEEDAAEAVKAFKLFDLFPQDAHGFSDSPGDAIAYKLFRQAREEKRRVKEATKHIKRALDIVESSAARERIEGLRETVEQGPAASVATDSARTTTPAREADVEIVRLSADEVGFCPMPVLGTIDDMRPSDVSTVQPAIRAGAFNSFKPTSWRGEWVALPEWPVLTRIERPFALHISRAHELQDHVPRLAENRGPALTLLDPDSSTSTASYRQEGDDENPLFLAKKQSAVAGVERVEVVPWIQSVREGNWEHIARIVVFVRPPAPAGVSLHSGMQSEWVE